MFGFLQRRTVRRLERQYRDKLEQARDLQRNGDVVGAARLTAEAEAVRVQIEAADAAPGDATTGG